MTQPRKVKKYPQRLCLACQTMKDKRELMRIVRSPQGEPALDPTGKAPGRGAYLCCAPECLKKAKKSRGLERALGVKISPELWAEIEARAAAFPPPATEPCMKEP